MTLAVAGIDPSLTATGVALPDGSLATLKMKPKDGDRRLQLIDHALVDLSPAIWNWKFVVMEDLPRNAMHAGITGMVQGVIRRRLIGENVPYALVVPSTLKKAATGNGRADKKELAVQYTKVTGLINKDDNQVDAYYLRQIGLALTGQAHTLVDVSTINKIKMPEGLEKVEL